MSERPTPLSVIPENIPEAMRQERRWVTWTYVWKEGKGDKPGKWDKPPFIVNSATGANTSDPQTWRTFDEAIAAYANGKADGIGFVLGDGWVGFDSDDGASYADILDTYTERSPSGRGVHAIAKGVKPGAKCRTGPYELYDAGRYFTVTGHRVGNRENVEDRTGNIKQLYDTLFPGANEETPAAAEPAESALTDEEVIVLASAAQNGEKFKLLWDGNFTGYSSQSEADSALCCILAYWTAKDPFQIDRLFRRSKLFRQKWDDRHGQYTYGQSTVENACKIVKDVYIPSFPLTDSGDAEFFAARYKAIVAYDARRLRWLIREEESGLWLPDVIDQIRNLMVEAMRLRQTEANALNDIDKRKSAWTWAVKGESTARLNNLTREARTKNGIANDSELKPWDAIQHLLGVPGGVVDLRTGEMRKAASAERVTMRTRVPYDPSATSELWDKTLLAISNDDPEWVRYLQRIGGYTITGDTSQDKWFLKHGKNGREGKGTIDNAWKGALGDYALELPAAVFEMRPRGNPDFDLSYLPGKRFVLSSESGSTLHLHHDRIKQMTGGDTMRVANKHEKSFEFLPACKLWLACNDLPTVTDDSLAFWARVIVIPFRRSFRGVENTVLRPALSTDPAHQSAVLAWLVKGAIDYYREGLGAMPASVREATNDFRDIAWPLTPFVREDCFTNADAFVAVGDFNLAYLRFCERQGVPSDRRLGWKRVLKLMEGRYKTTEVDLRSAGGKREKRYVGIGLRETVQETQDF